MDKHIENIENIVLFPQTTPTQKTTTTNHQQHINNIFISILDRYIDIWGGKL